MKRIYMDHAATTYLDPRVKKAMENFWLKDFGNPSSIYREARNARKVVESSRREIAKIINSQPEEIIFTSGGTESNNLAIFGIAGPAFAKASAGKHIITTEFEHHSVLNPIKFLEKKGFHVTYLDVGKEGIVNLRDVAKALQPNTILVSIMYANNEIGTIQPIAEIGKILKKHKVVFHTDACQVTGYLDLDVNKLGLDLMTVNGSKMYGPKGAGFLYIRKGIELQPLFYGGEQERDIRPGTENVPAIVGLAAALKIAHKEKIKERRRLIILRDYFIKRLMNEIPHIVLNGHPQKRLPNNINISVLGTEGESLLLYLDKAGIACSTGSACTSSSLEPSHVIMALAKGHKYAHSSLRFSLGRCNTKSDIDYVMKILPGIVEKLRKISATWQT